MSVRFLWRFKLRRGRAGPATSETPISFTPSPTPRPNLCPTPSTMEIWKQNGNMENLEISRPPLLNRTSVQRRQKWKYGNLETGSGDHLAGRGDPHGQRARRQPFGALLPVRREKRSKPSRRAFRFVCFFFILSKNTSARYTFSTKLPTFSEKWLDEIHVASRRVGRDLNVCGGVSRRRFVFRSLFFVFAAVVSAVLVFFSSVLVALLACGVFRLPHPLPPSLPPAIP